MKVLVPMSNVASAQERGSLAPVVDSVDISTVSRKITEASLKRASALFNLQSSNAIPALSLELSNGSVLTFESASGCGALLAQHRVFNNEISLDSRGVSMLITPYVKATYARLGINAGAIGLGSTLAATGLVGGPVGALVAVVFIFFDLFMADQARRREEYMRVNLLKVLNLFLPISTVLETAIDAVKKKATIYSTEFEGKILSVLEETLGQCRAHFEALSTHVATEAGNKDPKHLTADSLSYFLKYYVKGLKRFLFYKISYGYVKLSLNKLELLFDKISNHESFMKQVAELREVTLTYQDGHKLATVDGLTRLVAFGDSFEVLTALPSEIYSSVSEYTSPKWKYKYLLQDLPLRTGRLKVSMLNGGEAAVLPSIEDKDTTIYRAKCLGIATASSNGNTNTSDFIELLYGGSVETGFYAGLILLQPKAMKIVNGNRLSVLANLADGDVINSSLTVGRIKIDNSWVAARPLVVSTEPIELIPTVERVSVNLTGYDFSLNELLTRLLESSGVCGDLVRFLYHTDCLYNCDPESFKIWLLRLPTAQKLPFLVKVSGMNVFNSRENPYSDRGIKLNNAPVTLELQPWLARELKLGDVSVCFNEVGEKRIDQGVRMRYLFPNYSSDGWFDFWTDNMKAVTRYRINGNPFGYKFGNMAAFCELSVTLDHLVTEFQLPSSVTAAARAYEDRRDNLGP